MDLELNGLCPLPGVGSCSQVLRDRSNEKIFYNSATAARSICGKVHYCVSCPGWNKVTDARVVYSRWEFSKPVDCCCVPVTVPTGRQLDTFDTDIVIDASAHQTCCQVIKAPVTHEEARPQRL